MNYLGGNKKTFSQRIWWHICRNAQAESISQVLQKSHQSNAPRQAKMDGHLYNRREARTGNMVLPKAGVTCYYESSVLNQPFVVLPKTLSVRLKDGTKMPRTLIIEEDLTNFIPWIPIYR